MARIALWTFLLAAASALAAPFAYIPNSQGQLAVIDLATNAASAQVAVGPATISVSVSVAGDRVYVVDNTEHLVRVVDTATNTVIASIPVCTGAFVAALNPAGTRLVVTCGQNGIEFDIVDTATNTVIARPQTLAGAATVSWNPAGTRFYISNLTAGVVTVYDGGTFAQLDTVHGMLGTFALAFNPPGTRYYAGNLFGAVAVIDAESGSVLGGVELPSAAYWIAINPAGTRVFAPMPDVNQVAVIDTASMTIVGTITTESPAPVANVSADGTRLYLQLTNTGTLAVYDATTLARLGSIKYSSGTGGAYGQFVRPAAAAPAANTPGALSGQWWNHNESGWGIHFAQRGSNIFASWYTYDASGNPKWYVSTCAMSGAAACSGTVFQVQVSRGFFGIPFNTNAQVVTSAGTLGVTFSGNDAGTMSYTVSGVSRTVAIERQVLAASGTPPAVNYTDIWWGGASESGWGMALTQQFSTMFMAWYVYNNSGLPVWYVATMNVNAAGNGATGTLYRTTGPPFGAGFDPHAVQAFSVGTASLAFSDGNNGTLTYTVDGVTGSKTITRQLF